MRINTSVKGGEAAIEKAIIQGAVDTFKFTLQRLAIALQDRIRIYVRTAILNSPEYLSLVHGKLREEFGLPDAALRMDKIIKIWTHSIIVRVSNVRKTGGRLNGKLSLMMIDSNYSGVLNAPEATLFTTGGPLNWLEWLLLKGNEVIVRGYEVEKTSSGKSRTRAAIMKRSPGASWRVPPEFAGTAEDNFVTRALQGFDTEIDRIVREEVKSVYY